jgi:hypothetical protein
LPNIQQQVRPKIYFDNTTGKTIRFDIYRTRADFEYYRNVWRSGVTSPGNSGEPFSIYIDEVPDDSVFYVDWYSEDFLYENWRRRQGIDSTEEYGNNGGIELFFDNTNLPVTDVHYYDVTDMKSHVHNVCLKKNREDRQWKAVDAGVFEKNSWVSKWDTLTVYEKHMEISFTKHFIANVNTRNSNGSDVNEAWSYKFLPGYIAYEEIVLYKLDKPLDPPQPIITIFDTSGNGPHIPLPYNDIVDTIYYHLPTESFYYKLVSQ